ncbi:MAG: NAD(P)-binding domain-containing protein [Acidobacteriia bacterium]|nr:NAD(P)-binding domain-containing protein [Terriglobia bacterium]MBV8902711.1 NAD(P)-binding domain-containing protein [Terriglobia bacterium]MBV9744835.1 NAD(P)-binding domain-containing protein [Terriglobia bacterium]
MNIGIIGAGNLGTGLTKRLVPQGHAVMLSYSRDSEKLKALAQSLGARTGSPAEAAEFAEVLVLATPWGATSEALEQAGQPTKPKILWDCTNPLKPDMSGLEIGTTTSGGEEVAKLAPWANVVKAIPPFAEVLHSSAVLTGGVRPAVVVCGNDPEARAVVGTLVRDIEAEPVDGGPLKLARYTEPLGMLLVQLAYFQGFGGRIGFAFAREAAASNTQAS